MEGGGGRDAGGSPVRSCRVSGMGGGGLVVVH